uniref:Uncharacterized protein n=1 Tax=Romanomermis culicivorax TaxID=13658 RepID=A0A915L1H3_ROMCU
MMKENEKEKKRKTERHRKNTIIFSLFVENNNITDKTRNSQIAIFSTTLQSVLCSHTQCEFALERQPHLHEFYARQQAANCQHLSNAILYTSFANVILTIEKT